MFGLDLDGDGEEDIVDDLITIAMLEEDDDKGGCYVATCVYGSYDCPQVWTLRRYRDHRLAESFWGRLFIRIYYVISPTVVRWFGQTEWFRRFWKKQLDTWVGRLNASGYDDTPYQDRTW